MSDSYPVLRLTLEGEEGEFRAYPKANQWALMQNAEANKSGSAQDSLAAVYKLATTSVLPGDERDRFEAFMLEHGQDDALQDVLTDALFALWNGETRLPLEPTSSDSSASTGENGSTSTGDWSQQELPLAQPVLVNGSSIPA